MKRRPHSKPKFNLTPEETILWAELRELRGSKLAFRRQVKIGPFIVDFLCRKAKLVIEVDGAHHGEDPQWSHDQQRDAWLKSQGYLVMRFWNADIHNSLEDVLETIIDIVDNNIDPKFLPPLGGGKRNAVTFGGGRPNILPNIDTPPPPSLASLDLPPPEGGRKNS